MSASLRSSAHDYSHFFISDPTSSYVVEWIEGEMVATEFKPDGQGNFFSESGMPAVMTNYYVAQAEKYGLKTNEFFKHHPMADGVERAETIMAQLPEAKTVEDHFNICKSVWYSQYCKGETQWATESAGSYGFDEKTGKAYWFTQHSVVYDLAALKGYAIIQEGMSSPEIIEFGI